MMLLLAVASFFSKNYSLNRIKSKTVGDGQHGTARWATKREIAAIYRHVPFTPALWRNRERLPSVEQQGLVVGCNRAGKKVTALVDTGDIHCVMIGAAGVGKTAYFLYPNLEYACASGMSFLTTDTKADLFRNYAGVAANHYGYEVSVLDLRNPMRSGGFNMIYLVNRYMDEYLRDATNIPARAKAERYAKITAKTIIFSEGEDSSGYGQNSFFYDAAEGLLTATILLVAEFCAPEERHIVSVFKIIQELLEPVEKGQPSRFQQLMQLLPPDHKAKWFAGAALSSAGQAMQSVLSTAMARLNSFLDSELESILCFQTDIDAERFCKRKSAIFLVMPEEFNTRYFLISLIVQQLYREILSVADEHSGKLPNRVMMYLDEFGTIPKINSAEMMFSASRSRRVSMVPIIQSLAQLQKSYGKEGASIILDNCQDTIFGGFAPNSDTAETLSKSLGNQTVLSGNVTTGKKDPSQSLQMIGRPLMSSDQLKSLPKGSFIVTKTGAHPMKTTLELFFKWGITFDAPYEIAERASREVRYASADALKSVILERYPPTKKTRRSTPPKEKQAEEKPPVRVD
ncbi:type IV secretory system conjugative DNA transfer family protein [Ruminococcaceae bacterium OttesenSCG-928-L11]|nr:type IV secretory system conjugative DNA transfer family protein [Ruminococcaceae bacterium OttesenSCG-928-L11]